jgi:uncharacterized protein (DUF952 family)
MVRPMQYVFKILRADEWAIAIRGGEFKGSAIDHKDGFIHLSAAHQVRETAARHFAGQTDLVLVAFPEKGLSGLKWEPSRGGDLFPHVYGSIAVTAAGWVKRLPLVDGVHRFPEDAAT